MNPQTLPEWLEYIGNLDAEEIFSQGRAANTLDFVQTLREEGLSAQDLVQVLLAFARRYEELGVAVPAGGETQYLSYTDLLNSVEAPDLSDASLESPS